MGPIGVYDSPENGLPPGEYEHLVGPVLTKLHTGSSARDIAAHLAWDVRTNMGVPGRPGAHLKAAERIYAWFHGEDAE